MDRFWPSRRLAAYEIIDRKEATALRIWEAGHFLPLVEFLEDHDCLKVVTWESCIEAIAASDKTTGEELGSFYERCLSFVGAR